MSTLTSLMLLAQTRVGVGRIQGGWEYVWTSYGLTWAALALYALSLWLRRPKTAATDTKE
ncbi:hypothetical protein P2318_14290 [Myxococcaceae bacterium GXIMD 01537]